MTVSWLRLWHDMPNDPKWRTIARASNQSIPAVMAVYLHLLTNASANANERGRTQNVCNEDIANALDMECEQIDAIISAMQGRVLDGDLIKGWSKRQVEREDGSAARAKAWREAKKEEKQTQANASERKKTPDTDKDTDKDKEEKTNIAVSSLPAAPKADMVPVSKIVTLYHETLPKLPRVMMLTKKRKGQIEARWKSGVLPDLDTWKNFFVHVGNSKFLMGGVDPPPGKKRFVADLEWITNETNFTKIWEGKYHGQQGQVQRANV